MSVYGLGHDVVDVVAFGGQLAEPGSRMRNLFSVREVRQASARARLKNDGEAVHLAAKWAGKEAFLKAWCEALGEGDYPFTLDDFPWSGVEILDDSRGVPHVTLTGRLAEAFRDSIGGVLGGAGASGVEGVGRSGIGSTSGLGAGGAETSPYAVMRGSRPVDPSMGPYAVMRGASGTSSRGAASGAAGNLPARIHVSLSHDGSVASAMVIIDGD